EGNSTQKFNDEIPKNVDWNLQPGEINAVKERLNALSLAMTVYRVPSLENDARRIFEFAKSVGVETITSDQTPADLAAIDKLASEFAINVALCGNPKTVLAAVTNLSPRMGVCGDTAAWLKAGLKPIDVLSELKSRLLTINLAAATPNQSQFLKEMYR